MRGGERRRRRQLLWWRYGAPHLARLSWRLGAGATAYSREVLYQNMFYQGLRAEGIERPFYATRGAANFSLLYLLLRCMTELPVRRVVELGAGQSSLLLDCLAKPRGIQCLSVEHDPQWAERISAQVAHQVLLAPLVRRPVYGRLTTTYDLDPAACGPADLLLVDGPIGERRHSRRGALDWVAEALSPEHFLIVFDDAERPGEMDTIRAAVGQLERSGRAFGLRRLRAAHDQMLLAGGRLAPVLDF